ncbi:MAG: hypothetical protein ACJA06_002494 [Halocynthiibacter sp.]|jgi:hypothetical protein
MGASQSLLELVATARGEAAACQERISNVVKAMDGQAGSDAQIEELRAATVALELVAVDIFSVFEARMQHHFRRGPFSRKLKARLLEAGQTDLADRVHQYYLAINVLKHGKGASYRELLEAPSALVALRQAEDGVADDARPTVGLIDVCVPGFFDGLAATILEAHQFLESR